MVTLSSKIMGKTYIYFKYIYTHVLKTLFKVLQVDDWCVFLNKLKTWSEFVLKHFLRGPKKHFSAVTFIVRKEMQVVYTEDIYTLR